MIEDKAQELGRLLGQTEEYKALKRARERVRDDAEIRERMGAAERLAVEIERQARNGQEPAPAQVEEYDRALLALQAHPVYQQLAAAQANFEKLMVKVNERMLEGMEKGAASPIITLG